MPLSQRQVDFLRENNIPEARIAEMVQQAGGLIPDRGVQPGADPDPKAGGAPDIAARSVAEILADFKAGRISEGAAFDEMFVAFQQLGRTDVQARDNTIKIMGSANEDIQALGNRPGGIVAPFGETGEQRETAFQGFLGENFRGGLGSRTGGALRRQFSAIEPAFQASRGLGGIAPGTDFRDFLSQNIGGSPGGLGLADLVRGAAGLFGADLSGADQDIQRSFRQNLIENPNQGFNLALQSGLQNIPLFLQSSFRNLANRSFGRFRSGTPINPATGLPDIEGNPFLPEFVERGGFGGF